MYVTGCVGLVMGTQQQEETKDFSRLPSQWQNEKAWQQNVKIQQPMLGNLGYLI